MISLDVSQKFLSFIMRLAVLSLLTSVAVADPGWWFFDAWDGLSCGDAPQNGQIFLTTEGLGDSFCMSFDNGQRAYSYAASYFSEDIEARGYLHEHCEGPSKIIHNNTSRSLSRQLFRYSQKVVLE
ncbi:hypothetical protein N7532_011229 [Penicillium argentinense]|uniref:Uncharacterized protein n=1 Tax=Penicillium argentinense TaxID=1131581 RepID=A0A9W9JUR9_9EURO|nr:uncharacterized protein N7532_011229 [Penicillium argentinense]KAJ5082186.1 hypothetical protein N7532_011229 [Penicillium argentinense]